MDLERLAEYVERACAMIVTLRSDNRRLHQEIVRLRSRTEILEKAGKISQEKVSEILDACDRIR